MELEKPRKPAPRNIVARRVRVAREQNDPALTQDQLAGRLALLGVALDRGMIAKIETGRRCVYDYEVVGLAKALGVGIEWLLADGIAGEPKGERR